MSVTIAKKLPKTDADGIQHLEGRFASDAESFVVVAALVRTDFVKDLPHNADNPRQVQIAIDAVEALTDKDAATVEKILRGVYQARTGKKELPFEDDADDADAED